jgi:diadenosine tetraphosphate (Ap4A) HIT family hydrolase
MFKRTKEIEDIYIGYLKAKPNIIEEFNKQPIIKDYYLWKVIENRFPYNVSTHHLLIPKRPCKNKEDLDVHERIELRNIKKELANEYDTFMQHTSRARSVPEWYHEHLIVW